MGDRQFFFPSLTSNMYWDDTWNRPYPQPHLHPGTTAIGVPPMPYFDAALRPNNLPVANFSLEISNHNRVVNPGVSYDPFLYPTAASGSNLIPPNHIQGGPSCYDVFPVNSHMDYERVPFKRKVPNISMGYDRGNNNSHHGAGSSSSFSISSVNSQVTLPSGPQYWTCDSNSMHPGYNNNNLLTVAEVSERNVRSRQSLPVYLGNNQTGVNLPNNLPHHLHTTSNIYGFPTAGQWGHTPASWGDNRRIFSSGTGSFSHGMNQPLATNNNDGLEIEWGHQHNPLHNRISSTQLPTPYGPSAEVVSVGRSSYDQRTQPYRASLSHQPFSLDVPSAGRQPGVEAVPPLRHSRPLSIVGRSNERNGRSRGHYDGFQSFSYGNNARNEWGRTIYDSRSFLDQHRDMRLDIDNMSYEELLALGERIGNVSTGLSGDTISRYLVETAYCSLKQSQDNQEEESCAICLEEYKDEENVGNLLCGHDFHSSCIQKWLSIRDACPICKASALHESL